MRKEVLFAIIVGLTLGLIILFGIRLANQSAKQAASVSATLTPEETVAPTENNQAITITSPENHSVVNTSSVKITGKTQPNANLTITDTEDDALVTADQNGNFTTDLKLTGGANLIKLTLLKSDQTTESTKITVIYTTAKIDIPATATPSADTPVASSGAIKEDLTKRIKEAIDKNLKNTDDVLVGYAGTISDIKQGVFNLASDDTTLQITYTGSTVIQKDGKPLKPELISLKDNALVIGNLSSPDILIAKRIVITTKDDSLKLEKKVIFSPILKVDVKNNTLTLKIDDKSQAVSLSKKLKLDLKTLTLNQKIFGIIDNIEPTAPATLLQAKII